MEYLHKDEYMHLAPDEAGSVRVNHDSDDCQGDSKSMIITRKEDGTINACCFRCGLYGSYSEVYYRPATSTKPTVCLGDGSRPCLKLPYDAEGDHAKWPPQARVWIYGGRLSSDQTRELGAVYSPSMGRVLLPVYDWEERSRLIGWVSRKIKADDSRPKYLTETLDNSKFIWYNNTFGGSDTLVITEDILSALRTSKYYPSLSLLGVYLKPAALSIVKQYTKFIIWLDNDNPQVKRQQLVLKNSLELIGDVIILHTAKDPKSYSDDEMKEVLGI